MLTEEGYRQRFWRGYPFLRQLLERKDSSTPHGVDLLQLAGGDEPRTSIDHGPSGRLADVVAIAQLLASHRNDVDAAIRGDRQLTECITKEVRELLDEMEHRCHAFQQELARVFGRELETTRSIARSINDL